MAKLQEMSSLIQFVKPLPYDMRDFNLCAIRMKDPEKEKLIKFYFRFDHLFEHGISHKFLRTCYSEIGLENEFLSKLDSYEDIHGLSLKEFLLLFKAV